MEVAALLSDALDRIDGSARRVLDGLEPEELTWRPDPGANSIGWLIWHLTRVQDDHVADVAGRPQVWEEGRWAERFGLPAGAMDTGYGHAAEQAGALRPHSAEVLMSYLEAVAERTQAYLRRLGPDDLDRVVDTRWDPPVTLGYAS